MLEVKHSRPYFVLYKFIKFILKCIFFPLYRVKKIGIDKVPDKGKLIICSNHISYLDPLIIGVFIPRCIYFVAKKELYSNKFVSSLVTFLNSFPVDRESFSMKVFKTSFEILKNENALGLFPEGTRSPDGILGEGKKGVGFISVHSKAPILPVAVSGTNKVIQKPHKRLFFPKIKLIFGNLIETEEIVKKYDKKKAIDLVFNETMKEIKRLYNIIK
ncbi:MAG: lysophospholipid acyltransferase family protein [Actinomycetota bacterium]|nr:lysophospholipid acyltransferase family protein [Actinomycetota bacterium]